MEARSSERACASLVQARRHDFGSSMCRLKPPPERPLSRTDMHGPCSPRVISSRRFVVSAEATPRVCAMDRPSPARFVLPASCVYGEGSYPFAAIRTTTAHREFVDRVGSPCRHSVAVGSPRLSARPATIAQSLQDNHSRAFRLGGFEALSHLQHNMTKTGIMPQCSNCGKANGQCCRAHPSGPMARPRSLRPLISQTGLIHHSPFVMWHLPFNQFREELWKFCSTL